jgi:hypothetical protein
VDKGMKEMERKPRNNEKPKQLKHYQAQRQPNSCDVYLWNLGFFGFLIILIDCF